MPPLKSVSPRILVHTWKCCIADINPGPVSDCPVIKECELLCPRTNSFKTRDARVRLRLTGDWRLKLIMGRWQSFAGICKIKEHVLKHSCKRVAYQAVLIARVATWRLAICICSTTNLDEDFLTICRCHLKAEHSTIRSHSNLSCSFHQSCNLS